jgi:hypothetical protein
MEGCEIEQDGYQTACMLKEILDLDELPSIDQAIEVEQRLFAKLSTKIRQQTVVIGEARRLVDGLGYNIRALEQIHAGRLHDIRAIHNVHDCGPNGSCICEE